MRTELETLRIELQSEKEKIAAIEARINAIELNPKPDKYPKSKWIELWSKAEALTIKGQIFERKYILFAALVETCKEWNRIDEFEPIYDEPRTIIKNFNGTIFISTGILNGAIMLIDYTTAQLFLDTFRAELEQVKHLL